MRIAVVTKVIIMGKRAIAHINTTSTAIICRGIVKINIPAFKINPNNLNAIKNTARIRSMDNNSIVPPFFLIYDKYIYLFHYCQCIGD